MTRAMTDGRRVLEALSRRGLLVQQDKRLPSVVTLVAGEVLAGSWWSHPRAPRIFAVLTALADHPDVLFTKLLARKVTLVHRSLWPALLAVATGGESWQGRALSPAARRLLAGLSEAAGPVRASGAAARELECRLLARAAQVHTESGRHATALEAWPSWAARARVEPLASAGEGRATLEATAAALGAPPSALPWAPLTRRRGPRTAAP